MVQFVKHQTLDLSLSLDPRAVSSSPVLGSTLGMELRKKEGEKREKERRESEREKESQIGNALFEFKTTNHYK